MDSGVISKRFVKFVVEYCLRQRQQLGLTELLLLMMVRSISGEPSLAWCKPEVLKMNQDGKLLPIARLYGKEFLVDIENRQFRNFRDPDEVIWMYSERGRQMVKDMQGSSWDSFGVLTGIVGDTAGVLP